MCSYDGVYVDRDTADALQQISQARAAEFQEIGVTLPSSLITEGVCEIKVPVSRQRSSLPTFAAKSGIFPSILMTLLACSVAMTGDAVSKRWVGRVRLK
jgi:hypothetical protein